MSRLSPFGEKSLTLVAASFDDPAEAERVASTLKTDPGVDGEVSVIAPGDPAAARKMEPEQRGIWRTLLRSHLVLGIVGTLAGLAIALALIGQWDAAARSPGFTTLFLAVMGAFLGLMAGGLVTLRPDHGVVIRQVRDALEHGKWAVVVRPLSEACAKHALAMLEKSGATPMRSL